MRERAITFVCAIALAISGIAPASALEKGAQDGADLRGKRWNSTSVTKEGKPYELVEGSKLWVDFRRNGNREVVAWRAGCNFFGAGYEISGDAIVTGPVSGTEMGCRKALLRQDAFFARFFSRDPEFSVEGHELTLSTKRVTVQLERKP